MRSPDLEALFPNLAAEDYRLSSPATPRYNCIAWAAEDEERFWWPAPLGPYFWPPGVAREATLVAFIEVFRSMGYETCESDEREAGFGKGGALRWGEWGTNACRTVVAGGCLDQQAGTFRGYRACIAAGCRGVRLRDRGSRSQAATLGPTRRAAQQR